jgi:hypothetical protein
MRRRDFLKAMLAGGAAAVVAKVMPLPQLLKPRSDGMSRGIHGDNCFMEVEDFYKVYAEMDKKWGTRPDVIIVPPEMWSDFSGWLA